MAGTLIDYFMVEKNKESRGTTLAEDTRDKCHATAKKSLENHEKRCTAGLFAAAGQFGLDNDVLVYAPMVQESK